MQLNLSFRGTHALLLGHQALKTRPNYSSPLATRRTLQSSVPFVISQFDNSHIPLGHVDIYCNVAIPFANASP